MLSLMLIIGSRDERYSFCSHGAGSLDVELSVLFHTFCSSCTGLLHVPGHSRHGLSSGILYFLFRMTRIFFHWMPVGLALYLPSILCSNVDKETEKQLSIRVGMQLQICQSPFLFSGDSSIWHRSRNQNTILHS